MKRAFILNCLTTRMLIPLLACGGASFTGRCPEQTTLDLLKHEIAFDRRDGGPFAMVKQVRVHVWEQGRATAFYIAEQLPRDAPGVRLVYYYLDEALVNAKSCQTEGTWQLCVQQGLAQSEINFAGSRPQTCSITVDVAAIPPWAPSPDTEQKRRIAADLKREVAHYWGETTELVIRDFNLLDHEILFWGRYPAGGDGCTRCWFNWKSTPHCKGWLGFGQTPEEEIKSLIFAQPYRLK
jgi:hypothetical protein